MRLKKRLNNTLTCLSLLLLGLMGCESPYADLSNYELQEKLWACKQNTQPSPNYAIRCDNYKRECESRKSKGKMANC